MCTECRHWTVRKEWYDHMSIPKGDAIFQPSLYYFQMHHSGGGGGGALSLRDLC